MVPAESARPVTSGSSFIPVRLVGNSDAIAAIRVIQERQEIGTLLEAYPGVALVLDREKQILSVNSRGLVELGLNHPDLAIGKRFGETVGCVHEPEGPSGCGSSEACKFCGFFGALSGCQETHQPMVQDALVSVDESLRTLEYEASFSPLTLGGIELTLCFLRDKQSENRRRSLERVFFHDLLNTAGGISGMAHLLVDLEEGSNEEDLKIRLMMANLSNQLIDEIEHQRKLLAAETGELKPCVGPISSLETLKSVVDLMSSHSVAEDRCLFLSGNPVAQILETDGSLVRRVLINMAKNALEATPRGSTVSMGCDQKGSEIVFWVQNPTVMSEEVRHSLFKRSFSTKAKEGRGIGTYSMKLFAEKYLGGKIEFTSQEPEGTTFYLRLPI